MEFRSRRMQVPLAHAPSPLLSSSVPSRPRREGRQSRWTPQTSSAAAMRRLVSATDAP